MGEKPEKDPTIAEIEAAEIKLQRMREQAAAGDAKLQETYRRIADYQQKAATSIKDIRAKFREATEEKFITPAQSKSLNALLDDGDIQTAAALFESFLMGSDNRLN